MSPAEILELLKKIEKTGRRDTAHRLKAVEAEERAHKPHRTSLYDWQKMEMFLRAKLAAIHQG
jgi:hypothetical protein